MTIPSWDQFSALFEDPSSSKVRNAQASLFASYPAELRGYGADDDYLATFRAVFEIVLDWREGIFSFLEMLVEYLGPHVLKVEFDDDYERATVQFDGREASFYCPGIHHETFGVDMATLQNLMKDSYVFRIFYEGGIGDALEFLVVPVSMWARAEKRYGSARLSVCLKSFGSPVRLDEPYDATLRWRAPRGRFSLPRISMPVLLAVCIGAAIQIILLYTGYGKEKTIRIPTCESLSKVYGRLTAEQTNAIIEDARRKGVCR